MDNKFPDKRGHVYVKSIAIRVEAELWEVFELLKVTTKKDVPEAQRIVLRELAQRLKESTAS